ncbi:hypothetical protein OG792_19965 [Micromonospora sp. NBC_01699]|uniref:hypothetical protein n=1 Tax=Micromonospora sp. NBC_01699 TaxID=2975984 RepID=UPI002E2861AB|nr:hypothetical protein [Micromonospora sp. NBC_01699]
MPSSRLPFEADLARWFPDRPAIKLTTSVRPVAQFLARLSQRDAAALEGFDRRVRSGTLPWVLDIGDDSYDFPFAANDCDTFVVRSPVVDGGPVGRGPSR